MTGSIRRSILREPGGGELREPMSHRMEACTSREEATAKMNMTSEEKRKLKMMPARISMLLEKPFSEAAPSTAPMLRQQPVKQMSTMGRPLMPSRMAMTAPSAPPPDTPKV